MTAFDPADVAGDAALEPLPTVQIAGLLEAARDHIVVEFKAMGDAWARWQPTPDEWSANQCLGHIIEADRRGFAGRIARILETDGVIEHGWDQRAVALERADNDRTADAIIAEFVAGRDPAIELVRSIRATDLGRFAEHDRVGRISVRDLLHEWLFHDRNHLRQILANSQARAWPAMGNTRRFSHPDR